MQDPGLLPLLALMLFFAVSLVLISVLMLRFASSLTGRLVGDQFVFAEYIVEHRRPPPEWVCSRTAIERLLRHNAPTDARLCIPIDARQRERMKIHIIRRLAKLIQYFESNSFFEDADARTQLLNELVQIREFWIRHELPDIVQVPSD